MIRRDVVSCSINFQSWCFWALFSPNAPVSNALPLMKVSLKCPFSFFSFQSTFYPIYIGFEYIRTINVFLTHAYIYNRTGIECYFLRFFFLDCSELEVLIGWKYWWQCFQCLHTFWRSLDEIFWVQWGLGNLQPGFRWNWMSFYIAFRPLKCNLGHLRSSKRWITGWCSSGALDVCR